MPVWKDSRYTYICSYNGFAWDSQERADIARTQFQEIFKIHSYRLIKDQESESEKIHSIGIRFCFEHNRKVLILLIRTARWDISTENDLQWISRWWRPSLFESSQFARVDRKKLLKQNGRILWYFQWFHPICKSTLCGGWSFSSWIWIRRKKAGISSPDMFQLLQRCSLGLFLAINCWWRSIRQHIYCKNQIPIVFADPAKGTIYASDFGNVLFHIWQIIIQT